MERGLFVVKGAPGVGKTLLALTLAEIFETRLLRLQCYEGLDLASAAYEWNYPRQLLELQAGRGDLYREDMLLRRPLVQAIDASHARAPVLLVDDIHRADEEFEAFLLELLGRLPITIPELGTLRAQASPDRGAHLEPHARGARRAQAARRLTTGLTIRRPSATSRISAARTCLRSTSCCAAASSRSSRRCAASSSRRRRASPRPSIGPPRCIISARRAARCRYGAADARAITQVHRRPLERVRGPVLDELFGVAANA